MVTVPAHNLLAPVRACVMAAARVMPFVCGVFGSSWSLRIIFTPSSRQSIFGASSATIDYIARWQWDNKCENIAVYKLLPKLAVFFQRELQTYGSYESSVLCYLLSAICYLLFRTRFSRVRTGFRRIVADRHSRRTRPQRCHCCAPAVQYQPATPPMLRRHRVRSPVSFLRTRIASRP